MLSILRSDSYKQFHYKMYIKGIEKLYSNFTPRSFKYLKSERVVFFGLQYYIKRYLIEDWNINFFNKPLSEVISEYKRFHKHFSGVDIDTSHIEKLHTLGYLPLEIKALSEGSRVKEKIPLFTIINTHPDFAWLVNFIETQISISIWHPTVVATIGDMYKKLLNKWAIKTTGSIEGVQWQGHDFAMRGLSSAESANNQAGWLLSFNGSDTIPAVYMLEDYYNANMENELIAASVPASEHSVMTSYGKENEIDAFKRLLEQFPSGILSVVSDSFDLWKVCTEYLVELKDQILTRDGKLVIRPDSGNPVDILCGMNYKKFNNETYEEFQIDCAEYLNDKLSVETPHGEYGGSITETILWNNQLYKVNYDPDWNRYDKQYYFIDNYGTTVSKCSFEEIETKPSDIGVIELLWDVFRGTVNEQGYKVLDPHIGCIYGDSITLERADEICKRLEAKGFASTNIVYGVGSYTFQMVSRDSLGIAVKSTWCQVNGEEREIFKDPITDDGIKKSAKGLLAVYKDTEGEYYLKDQATWEEVENCELKTVFLDGNLVKETSLSEIRTLLSNQKFS